MSSLDEQQRLLRQLGVAVQKVNNLHPAAARKLLITQTT